MATTTIDLDNAMNLIKEELLLEMCNQVEEQTEENKEFYEATK